MKPEKFTRTEVALVDADGVSILEGSVLRHIQDGAQGVVTRIVRAGDTVAPFMACVGDIGIRTAPGCTRMTNCYTAWRHVPHAQQTYHERFLSWTQKKYDHDHDRDVSEDEGMAIDGIMRLLPEDTVDWERGPWADTLEDALNFLAQHLGSGSFPHH